MGMLEHDRLHDEVALGHHRDERTADRSLDRRVGARGEVGLERVAPRRDVRIVLHVRFLDIQVGKLLAARIEDLARGIEDEVICMCRAQVRKQNAPGKLANPSGCGGLPRLRRASRMAR